jgi:hypothetical protein
MRLPRVQFTLRRLMVAVAIVGLTVGIGIEGERRRSRFLRIAIDHSHQAILRLSGNTWSPLRMVEMQKAYAHYHDLMAQKYKRAARYPWLPVAPDPPKPK